MHLAAAVNLNWQQRSYILMHIFRRVTAEKKGRKKNEKKKKNEESEGKEIKLFPHSSESSHKEDPMATARPTVCLIKIQE